MTRGLLYPNTRGHCWQYYRYRKYNTGARILPAWHLIDGNTINIEISKDFKVSTVSIV